MDGLSVPENENISGSKGSNKKRLLLWVAVGVSIFLILVSVLAYIHLPPSVIRRSITTLRCGHRPVIAHNGFYGDKEYFLPDNESYDDADTNFLSSDAKYFCTENEAKSAGYVKVLSSAEVAKKLNEDRKQNSGQQIQLAQGLAYQTFTPAYLPAGEKKNGFKYGKVSGKATNFKESTVTEEETIPPNLWIEQLDATIFAQDAMCDNVCQPYAKDTAGHQIYTSQGVNTGVYHYGLQINNTLLDIQLKNTLTRQEVLSILNSLRPTTKAERETLYKD